MFALYFWPVFKIQTINAEDAVFWEYKLPSDNSFH